MLRKKNTFIPFFTLRTYAQFMMIKKKMNLNTRNILVTIAPEEIYMPKQISKDLTVD
jgi:hypothetical protein